MSAGEDNGELVDNLVDADYIKSASVEAVSRAVDRGFYYTARQRDNAYRDAAWKQGNLHLSAPCIYSQVLEALKLQPGQSFLNIGSGTGYLSTMAGLILGHRGTNQGIELHPEVVEYANKKLSRFVLNSHALYRYDFCEPVFVQGNGLLLCDGPQFDRVYCGASVAPEYCARVQSLLKVDGVLVMPMNDQLVQVTRVSENRFVTQNMLPVSFASLVVPPQSRSATSREVRLPDWQPIGLKVLCGRLIFSLVRRVVAQEMPVFQPSLSLGRPGGNQKRKKYVKRVSEVQEALRPGSSDSSSDSTGDADDVLQFNLQSLDESIRNRVTLVPSLSAVIHRVVGREADTSSSSSCGTESDSGVAASPPVPVGTTVSSVQSTSSSSGENRPKRCCSTTEEDDDAVKQDTPSASSSGNSSAEDRIRLARALATGIRERRRAKLQRIAQTSSSSSSSSLSSSSSSSSSASSSNSDRSLRRIDETECSDDDDVGQGIHLLRTRQDDRFVIRMQENIRQLPLPPILQSFVNLNRAVN